MYTLICIGTLFRSDKQCAMCLAVVERCQSLRAMQRDVIIHLIRAFIRQGFINLRLIECGENDGYLVTKH